MNAVKKCSLSGIAFTMDPEAYTELDRYLATLKESYKESAEGAEIVADIEARIAELILATQSADRVVGTALIRNIIAQMGSANEINDEEPRPVHSGAARSPRRLYRDSENAKLGGVCAGLGKYFDLDPVWVRLACFLPLMLCAGRGIPFIGWWLSPLAGNLFAVVVICYLVMWFAVPVARTARQKLEMTGERITADSISKTAYAVNDPDGATKTVVAETVSVFGKFVLVLLKLFAGLIIFGLVIAACAMLVGLIYISVAGHEAIPIHLPLSIPILGIFIGLIPVLIMIYVLMCLVASRKPSSRGMLGAFLLWLATIIACCTVAFHNRNRFDPEEIISASVHEIADRELGEIDLRIRLDDRDLTAEELLRKIESGEMMRGVQMRLQSAVQPADSTAARTEKVQAGGRKMTVTIDENKGLSVETDDKKMELTISDKK